MEQEARKTKKTLKGVVVKIVDEKTIKVDVERKAAHPLYQKILKSNKKYLADRNGIEVEVGNQVIIEETTPVSKNKKFKLIEVAK
ncbi:30S ribosomal protein S17 [Candidatus Dojkabacteria bacterium]|nr:30S ribosomal protein S17 [Candidatus Dojkabacteria bacterium]